jgi:hypothetical protein
VIGRAVLSGMRTSMRIINHLAPVKNTTDHQRAAADTTATTNADFH